MTGQLLMCFLIATFFGLVAQRMRGNLLVFSICFGFALQYSYSLGTLTAFGRFEGNFGVSQGWLLLASTLVLLFVVVQIASSAMVWRSKLLVDQGSDSQAVFAFFVLSVVGLVLIATTAGFAIEDRLQARSGSGFVFVFGYAGLGLCLGIAAGLLGRRRFTLTAILCLPTFLFFTVAGHRSVALIVLLCPFAPAIRRACDRRAYLLPLGFGVTLLGANYINLVTGSIRSLWVQGRGLSLEGVSERYEALRSAQPIPLATSHLEMLAGYLEEADISDLLVGTFETIAESLLNFLPRALFPEKGYTSGVHFASVYFPEWFSYGYHSSSLTTGIFLDFVYNFGVPLSFFLLVSLYLAVGIVVSRLLRMTRFEAVLGAYLCWLFGFNVFFDDLGGIVNKMIIGVVFYFSARIIGGVWRLIRGAIT